MIRITWNPKDIYRDPYNAYGRFSRTVTSAVSRRRAISGENFYAGFKTFAEAYEDQSNPQAFTSMSQNLIEYLVNQGQDNLAGIAYSILIKLNKNNSQVVENLAIKGLAIAKRFNDPIHIMARADDLKELYEKTEPGSERHIKYLRMEHKALKDICKNYYSSLQKRYYSISRQLKPLENYELMLCAVKLDIVKYTHEKELHDAKIELDLAKALLNKNRKSKNRKMISMLSRRVAKREAELGLL